MRPIGDWSMSMILSRCSTPSMRSCAPGCSRAPFRRRAERLVERVDDQRRLAAARHAGDAGEGAERESRGDVLQVVGARAHHARGSGRAGRGRRSSGTSMRRRPVRYCAGEAVGICQHLRRACPRRRRGRRGCRRPAPCRSDDRRCGSPPRHARRRARCCRGRAAAAASRAAGRCRAGAGRSRARPAHRARRSGRSRSGWPAGCAGSRRPTACRSRATGQIVEPDIVQEAQPLADLPQDALGDLALLRRQRARSSAANHSPACEDREFA